MPSDRCEHPQMIEDCEARESRLSEWEAHFIDSIKAQLARGAQLTSKQVAILDGIWEEATR